jgi:hypothetical protein
MAPRSLLRCFVCQFERVVDQAEPPSERSIAAAVRHGQEPGDIDVRQEAIKEHFGNCPHSVTNDAYWKKGAVELYRESASGIVARGPGDFDLLDRAGERWMRLAPLAEV